MKLKTGNQWRKSGKPKAGSFEKVNIIDKRIAGLTKKRETTQITNIRNEIGDTTTDPMDIKRIIKKYYE